MEERIEKFDTNNCLIAVKDYKGDFHSNPAYRLVYLSKTQMGDISKVIL